MMINMDRYKFWLPILSFHRLVPSLVVPTGRIVDFVVHVISIAHIQRIPAA